jgi:endoglucanase
MQRNRILGLLTLGFGLFWASCTKTGDQIANTVYSVGSSGTALDNMARGVNLTNWFNDFSNPAEFSNRFGTAHFQMIKQAGFTYVRLPIGPNVIMEGGNSPVLQPTNLSHIDNAVQRITQAGLSVMLDLHPYTRNFETRLATDPVARNNFRLFWRNMANHFKKYDTSQVFFEIMNEPNIGSAQAVAGIDVNWWAPVQEMAINAIREATPNH